jgi:hypothetical protein
MGMMKHIVNVGRKFRTAAMKKVRPKTFGPKAEQVTEGVKQKRITFKGQDMTEKNFHKSFKMSGSYKYGTIVSKEAMRTSPRFKLSGGGTGSKKALLDSYGQKGYKNYKTRVYER